MGGMLFWYVIFVCSRADENCPSIFPGMGERILLPFEDPAAFKGSDEEAEKVFEKTRDLIHGKLLVWQNSLEKD